MDRDKFPCRKKEMDCRSQKDLKWCPGTGGNMTDLCSHLEGDDGQRAISRSPSVRQVQSLDPYLEHQIVRASQGRRSVLNLWVHIH